MTDLRIVTISADELDARIEAAVKRALAERPSPLRLLPAAEAAELLGVKRDTLIGWARDGEIPHRRSGRKYLFAEPELRAWVEQRRAG
jgi:excisionase family DNA binding protein